MCVCVVCGPGGVCEYVCVCSVNRDVCVWGVCDPGDVCVCVCVVGRDPRIGNKRPTPLRYHP